jgi:hypothetical protein
LSVLDVWKQLTSSDAIAPQFVRHDHSRDVLQTLQNLSEEALRGVGIAPGLSEDIEHNAILISGNPGRNAAREILRDRSLPTAISLALRGR